MKKLLAVIISVMIMAMPCMAFAESSYNDNDDEINMDQQFSDSQDVGQNFSLDFDKFTPKDPQKMPRITFKGDAGVSRLDYMAKGKAF